MRSGIRRVGRGVVVLALATVLLGVLPQARAMPPAQSLLSFDDVVPTKGRLGFDAKEVVYQFDCVEGGIGSVIVTTISGDLKVQLDVLNTLLQTVAQGDVVSESPFVTVVEAFEMPTDGPCTVRLRGEGGTSGTYEVRLLPGFARLQAWDTFDSLGTPSLTWSPYASNSMTVTNVNESLRIEVLTDNLLAYALPDEDLTPADVYIQADFRIQGTPTYSEYGFVLRGTSDPETFYSVVFSSDGDYSVYYFDGEWTAVQDWTVSPVVDGDDKQPRVAVMVRGNVFRLFFNGRFVAEVIDDQAFASEGTIGVAAATGVDQTDPLTVFVDNVVITEPYPRAETATLPFGGQPATGPTPTRPSLFDSLGGATKEPEPTPATTLSIPTATPQPQMGSRYPAQLRNGSSDDPAVIIAELQGLGLVPAGGSIALSVPSSYGDTSTSGFSFYRLGQGQQFTNFVLSFDARLVYSGSGAGCGMYFRDDGTANNTAMVFEDGWALLGEWDEAGSLMDTSVLDAFAAVRPGIEVSNRVIVVADGSLVLMYVNGTLVAEAEFTPRTGEVALEMFVPQDDAGTTAATYCQLNNIWLWAF